MQIKRLRIFKQYLWLALLVVLARVAFRIIFDKFSLDNTLASAIDGLKLSAWVVGFGLLNAILDFRKLLPKSPKFLKTITTALNISLALTPEIVRSIDRVKFATKLRNHRRGVHLIRSLVVPVVSNAIDQALCLGESMAARGYGTSKVSSLSDGTITLRNQNFSYPSGLSVLRKLSLSIPSGSLVLISGKTGSGKSTLLRVIQAKYPDAGFVNQFPRDGFVCDKVFDELAFALIQRGFSGQEVESRVTKVAKDFGLLGFQQHEPQNLPAGMQQRLAIAASVVSGNKILLLDEPFSSLDEPSTQNFLSVLDVLRRLGTTVIVAEHRIELLSQLADLKFTLTNGSLTDGIESPKSIIREKITEGSITALFGENGSGKTTFLRQIASERGTLVPQPAADLLFLNSIEEELQQADRDADTHQGTAAAILDGFLGPIDPTQNPRDLSHGQKLALALSIQLSKTTDLLLLDEPTLGFDFEAKQTLIGHLKKVALQGVEIIVATHDREFAESVATKIQRIKNGVITDV